jgi:hypothetical protein
MGIGQRVDQGLKPLGILDSAEGQSCRAPRGECVVDNVHCAEIKNIDRFSLGHNDI